MQRIRNILLLAGGIKCPKLFLSFRQTRSTVIYGRQQLCTKPIIYLCGQIGVKADESQKTCGLKSKWERAEQIFQTKLPYLNNIAKAYKIRSFLSNKTVGHFCRFQMFLGKKHFSVGQCPMSDRYFDHYKLIQ